MSNFNALLTHYVVMTFVHHVAFALQRSQWLKERRLPRRSDGAGWVLQQQWQRILDGDKYIYCHHFSPGDMMPRGGAIWRRIQQWQRWVLMAGLGGLIGGWRNICNSLPVSDDGPEFLNWRWNRQAGVSSSTWWASRRMGWRRHQWNLIRAELHQTDPIQIHLRH